uniref:Uncharacterized protein n=1 Tax=Eutreptiella gymnastica TaxID=73025 RepID=A0A7S4LDR8_9EUGL
MHQGLWCFVTPQRLVCNGRARDDETVAPYGLSWTVGSAMPMHLPKGVTTFHTGFCALCHLGYRVPSQSGRVQCPVRRAQRVKPWLQVPSPPDGRVQLVVVVFHRNLWRWRGPVLHGTG